MKRRTFLGGLATATAGLTISELCFAAGRDHWPSTQVVAIGGGGIKRGLIVGATNARSEYPIERPLSVQDLGATIYHALGIPASLEYLSTVSNRPIKVLDSGEPIAELI